SVAILLLNLAGVLRRRAQMSHKAFLSFIIALVPMTVALILQVFVDLLPIFDISYVLSAFSMYSFILSDQIEQDRRHQQEIAEQQREIAQERISVLVLQMRPHFIYNTLMSIYSLCRFNPQKARQVTMDFTNYLRKNFNAGVSDSAIPFATELEHTQAYLSVEKAQYDDMLVVDYDTPYTHFRLPPLTLQPIVENAVKHGMDLDSDPLHISIRTRHTDAGTEIIVEDNGRGFDPADDSKPGITLKNIRQRLEIMCKGCMTISSREGNGTVVTVTIPDSAAQETHH
ncbi:MAG: histidine kinase, partial [Clostridia bacterium]|nr:histidine kinase [Clostridia bacterium]